MQDRRGFFFQQLPAFYIALSSRLSFRQHYFSSICVLATFEGLVVRGQSSEMCTYLTKTLCNSVYCLEVMFIAIDIFMKLLKNEFVFHRVNKHVVPLGVSRNIMNISNNCFEVGAHMGTVPAFGKIVTHIF